MVSPLGTGSSSVSCCTARLNSKDAAVRLICSFGTHEGSGLARVLRELDQQIGRRHFAVQSGPCGPGRLIVGDDILEVGCFAGFFASPMRPRRAFPGSRVRHLAGCDRRPARHRLDGLGLTVEAAVANAVCLPRRYVDP